jgi:tetratricopeptide (TPR) repeat protein
MSDVREASRGRPSAWSTRLAMLVGHLRGPVLGLVVVVGIAVLVLRGWRWGRSVALKQACLDARATGDWEEMERQAVRWTTVAPDSAAPFVYAAEASLARSDMSRAADLLALVPDEDPAAVPALLERVDMLFADLAEPLEAERTCRRILAIDPASGPAHQRLTFFYAVTLQRRQMALQARRAIELGCELPEAYVYLVGADWITLSNIPRVNRPWLDRDPGNELFLVAIACGESAARGLDFSDATGSAAVDPTTKGPDQGATLTPLLARFPHNQELLANQIEEAIISGQTAKVAALLAQVPAAGMDDNRFWRFKGWLECCRQEFAQATTSLERALLIHPFDFMAQHYLADVCRKQDRPEQAASLARLADEGRSLRRTILTQPEVRTMPLAVMERIASYAEGCGDAALAARLRSRIAQRRQ